MYSILLQHLFICYSSDVQSIMRLFLYSQREHVFVTELNNKHFTIQIFQESFLNGLVLHGHLLQSLLENGVDISQGSVATQLRCGGIFKYKFVANLPLSLTVKEF